MWVTWVCVRMERNGRIVAIESSVRNLTVAYCFNGNVRLSKLMLRFLVVITYTLSFSKPIGLHYYSIYYKYTIQYLVIGPLSKNDEAQSV